MINPVVLTPRGGLELIQVEELAKVINPVVLTQSPDSWSWTLNNSGGYTVASSRNMIDSRLLPKGDLKTRWIRYVPNKLNTFAWKVKTNTLPTRFNISRRGIDIESLSCVNCDVEIDSILSCDCDYDPLLNKKRNILNIRGIMIDGIWIDNPNRVKREFFNHFSKRFCKPDPRRALIQMKYQKCLSSEQRTKLESEVTNDEIKRAVWDCGMDKAPGPDGFIFGFYRRFWYIIESDVYDAVKHFFTYKDIPKGCNSSFIALIPKIPGANLVKDFRHISLIESLYKIIAKIMANRLVGVLGDIVLLIERVNVFKWVWRFYTSKIILYGARVILRRISWGWDDGFIYGIGAIADELDLNLDRGKITSFGPRICGGVKGARFKKLVIRIYMALESRKVDYCWDIEKGQRRLDICSSRVAWPDKLFALSLAGGTFLIWSSNHTMVGWLGW
ncbi:RNA-directed DNA polymerase, eukaryota, reverse transcriptase zinc-binding domain protein [Tanacetum coccineum]